MFNNLEFAYPHLFWALLVIPVLIGWYIWKHREIKPSVNISSISTFGKSLHTGTNFIPPVLFGIKLLGLGLLVIGLARPQKSKSWSNIKTNGVDIVITMDISTSMLAKDFKPNRLEASKEVATRFINQRKQDRVGLVVYGSESFTQCPLTTDHAVLTHLFQDVKEGMVDGGTAIGMGLGTAVSRLKESEAKSKVIILLTDGVNNAGFIDPVEAAKMAKLFDIKVYTIGVGTIGQAYAPYSITSSGKYQYKMTNVEIDEKLLKKIAEVTGGKYFRATDKQKLKEVYNEIDQLEKTEIKVTEFSQKEELFFPWILWGCILFLLIFLLKNTLLRTLP